MAPNVWQYNALLLSESILALTFGLYLLTLYRLWDRPSIGAATFAGVTLALAGYNRAEFLLLGVLAIPIVLRNPHLAGARFRVGRIVVVGVVAGSRRIAPWTIRNLTTFQRPVLFSDNVDSVLAERRTVPKTYSRTRDRGVGFWLLRGGVPARVGRERGVLRSASRRHPVLPPPSRRGPAGGAGQRRQELGLLQAVRGDRERRSRRVAVDRERLVLLALGRARRRSSRHAACAAPAG